MERLKNPGLGALEGLMDTEERRIRDLVGDADSPLADLIAPEPRDDVDLASEEVDERLQDAMLDHYRAQLADIEAARDRIRRGEYGICIDCRQSIPYARLKAYPTAKRCAVCQHRHEQLYAADRAK
ncbi:RNA polymerase-binding transcription factor DksA [Pandoraea eparura]|jgi:RNA polymerase-binding transcription factor DksA|uniref:RNA polymerase-binding transcription factor DksA n=1 Tax=Pandoraea eparura TaxID=2508291 RepID=A0A5E4XIW0_9BURK|nr:TraR/DksA C4-type zinc finger protein [Pandoraea eparura]VVE36237.1 RNA polymerase-binding transcription factor DksA [Pandoraea eparura]